MHHRTLHQLEELAKDEDRDVRKTVAANPSTPPEVLAELAKDEYWSTHRAVAKNPSTPPEVLAELAKDEWNEVRANVALNPSTPPEVLIELAKDKEWFVRDLAAQNPNTPKEENRDTPYLSKTEEGYKLSGSLDSLLSGMSEKHGTERSEPSKEQQDR